jgi:hypothetical protein
MKIQITLGGISEEEAIAVREVMQIWGAKLREAEIRVRE